MADPAAEQGHASQAVPVSIDSINLSHSCSNSLAIFANEFKSKSIGMGREHQSRLLEEQQNQSHPALTYTRRAGWSGNDEAAARKLWLDKKNAWTISAVEQHYMTVWKACLQYAGCTPWDIVGEKTRLRFENEVPKRPGDSCMWSKGFCLTLAQLVTHVAWPRHSTGAHAMNIAAALQYAVILRTNDCRPWNPVPKSKDPLYLAMGKQARSLRARHAEIRLGCAKSLVNLSVMSDIFLAMEDEISTPAITFSPAMDGMYAVGTWDLQKIKQALDKMHAPRIGTLGYLPTSLQYFAAVDARPLRVFPGKSNIDGIHEVAMLEERRRRIEQSVDGTADGVRYSQGNTDRKRRDRSLMNSGNNDSGGDESDNYGDSSDSDNSHPLYNTLKRLLKEERKGHKRQRRRNQQRRRNRPHRRASNSSHEDAQAHAYAPDAPEGSTCNGYMPMHSEHDAAQRPLEHSHSSDGRPSEDSRPSDGRTDLPALSRGRMPSQEFGYLSHSSSNPSRDRLTSQVLMAVNITSRAIPNPVPPSGRL
ncbi:hypothetical protein NLG97_g6957 [Lecanicillium saksenae]|uniref:Uncharacterized protein n=1 Tax=Lecanicillium saksenae TaxID=468837 RepID=A0ACC1QN63_9HYPO|nr:hypothetical protein NLG97_g6957 [Lecanicillium saksenae]